MDERDCRICGDDNGTLIRPCKCKGTVAHVHVDCLSQWLRTSGRTKCEVCGYVFQYQLSSTSRQVFSLLSTILREWGPAAVVLVVPWLLSFAIWPDVLPKLWQSSSLLFWMTYLCFYFISGHALMAYLENIWEVSRNPRGYLGLHRNEIEFVSRFGILPWESLSSERPSEIPKSAQRKILLGVGFICLARLSPSLIETCGLFHLMVVAWKRNWRAIPAIGTYVILQRVLWNVSSHRWININRWMIHIAEGHLSCDLLFQSRTVEVLFITTFFSRISFLKSSLFNPWFTRGYLKFGMWHLTNGRRSHQARILLLAFLGYLLKCFVDGVLLLLYSPVETAAPNSSSSLFADGLAVVCGQPKGSVPDHIACMVLFTLGWSIVISSSEALQRFQFPALQTYDLWTSWPLLKLLGLDDILRAPTSDFSGEGYEHPLARTEVTNIVFPQRTPDDGEEEEQEQVVRVPEENSDLRGLVSAWSAFSAEDLEGILRERENRLFPFWYPVSVICVSGVDAVHEILVFVLRSVLGRALRTRVLPGDGIFHVLFDESLGEVLLMIAFGLVSGSFLRKRSIQWTRLELLVSIVLSQVFLVQILFGYPNLRSEMEIARAHFVTPFVPYLAQGLLYLSIRNCSFFKEEQQLLCVGVRKAFTWSLSALTFLPSVDAENVDTMRTIRWHGTLFFFGFAALTTWLGWYGWAYVGFYCSLLLVVYWVRRRCPECQQKHFWTSHEVVNREE